MMDLARSQQLRTLFWVLFGSNVVVMGCIFDCHFDANNPSHNIDICAGDPVQITTHYAHGFELNPAFNNDVDMQQILMDTDFGTPNVVAVPHRYLALDLVGRQIESIVDEGLSCFDFVPYKFGGADTPNGEPEPAVPSGNNPVLRGVILDDNMLSMAPNLSAWGLQNASHISIKCNVITKLVATIGNSTIPFFDEMTSVFINVSLDGNKIAELPTSLLDNIFSNAYIGISLCNNLITYVPTGVLSGRFSLARVSIILNGNSIETLPSNFFNTQSDLVFMYLDVVQLSFDSNRISKFPTNFFSQQNYNIGTVQVSLRSNELMELPTAMFNGSQVFNKIIMMLNDNSIETLPAELFNTTRNVEAISLSLTNNKVSILPLGLFTPILFVNKVVLFLNDNSIVEAGSVFWRWSTFSSVYLSLANNFITSTGLQNIIRSFNNITGQLVVDASHNSIVSVPDYLFAGVGLYVIASYSYPEITLDLTNQRNEGLLWLSQFAFAGQSIPLGWDPVHLSSLTLNLSDNQNLQIPGDFSFHQSNQGQVFHTLKLQMRKTNQTDLPLVYFVGFGRSHSFIDSLVLDFSMNTIHLSHLEIFETNVYISSFVTVDLFLHNNGITSLPLNVFHSFHGTLDLSHNNISRLRNSTFSGSPLTSINLSHNAIVEIEPNAFDTSVSLTSLDLSYNKLAMITTNFTDNTPVLQHLIVRGNNVRYLPKLIGNNRIFVAADAQDNVLECESYSPSLANCTCKGDLVFNEFCGYGRCSQLRSGCNNLAELPSDDCSAAPIIFCVVNCSSGYLSSLSSSALGVSNVATCIPYTDCTTTFGESAQGYEFRPATSTTDRVCSACSVCSPGFDSTPCTATSNTVCTRTLQLTLGDISAIVVTVILVFVGTAGGTSYVFMRKKEEKKGHALELSQMLLGEVNEENSRMRKAWEICEDDLHIEKKLASGSFGVVWSATWGHIPVAVKTLHAHLAEFPSEMVEFEREAIFMQSIRHPNLLIFYGAGIKSDGTPFLVVELMAKGSMSDLIKKESLPWATRRRFALEVAQGMAHLHSLDSLHRDLKSDNCLVDDKLHVKVGDFGKSRLIMAYYGQQQQHGPEQQQEQHQSNTSSMTTSTRLSGHEGDWSKSLTSDVGTLLWMAPELFDRDKKIYGKEVDVYSFGIVMWELLTMEVPWDNHFNDAPSLIVIRRELTQMLLSGKRPTLPEHSNDTDYALYIALMKRCWATQADTRPPFASVAALLVDIAE